MPEARRNDSAQRMLRVRQPDGTIKIVAFGPTADELQRLANWREWNAQWEWREKALARARRRRELRQIRRRERARRQNRNALAFGYVFDMQLGCIVLAFTRAGAA